MRSDGDIKGSRGGKPEKKGNGLGARKNVLWWGESEVIMETTRKGRNRVTGVRTWPSIPRAMAEARLGEYIDATAEGMRRKLRPPGARMMHANKDTTRMPREEDLVNVPIKWDAAVPRRGRGRGASRGRGARHGRGHGRRGTMAVTSSHAGWLSTDFSSSEASPERIPVWSTGEDRRRRRVGDDFWITAEEHRASEVTSNAR